MVPLTEAQLTRTVWSYLVPGGAKELQYPQFGCTHARLVVLAWMLAAGGHQRRALLLLSWRRRKPDGSQKMAEQAWMWWGAILSCAAAKVVTTCLLGFRCAHGADGDTPLSWEVDHSHAGLAA